MSEIDNTESNGNRGQEMVGNAQDVFVQQRGCGLFQLNLRGVAGEVDTMTAPTTGEVTAALGGALTTNGGDRQKYSLAAVERSPRMIQHYECT